MRKIMIIIIIIILLLMASFSYSYSSVTVFVKRIDLNLKSDEFGITFLNFDNSNYLLLSKKNKEMLLVLDDNMKDYNNLYKALNTYGVYNIDVVISLTNTRIKAKEKYALGNIFILDDIEFIRKNNFITINYYDNKMGIISGNNNVDIEDYKFLYFIKNSNNYYADLDDDLDIIFYNKNVIFNGKFIEEMYSEGINLYQIGSDEYTTLKLNFDDYNMISVPNY